MQVFFLFFFQAARDAWHKPQYVVYGVTRTTNIHYILWYGSYPGVAGILALEGSFERGGYVSRVGELYYRHRAGDGNFNGEAYYG